VETNERAAALTFDDGPHPDFTPRLLEILKHYDVRSTFFMVGEAATKRPDLVRRVAEEGHTIGNHSWDHPTFPLLTGRERRLQMSRCAKILEPYGRRLFRPPYGAQSLASRLDAWRLGLRVIGWNLEAKDWRDPCAQSMADRLVQGMQPGSIVLLHDAIHRSKQSVPLYDRGPTLDAVRMLLEKLSGSFRFVTIPELLRLGKPHGAIPSGAGGIQT